MRFELTQEVFEAIQNTVGSRPAETGGLLGGRLDGPITHYFFDETGECGGAAYSPDTAAVNRKLREWPADIRLRGFVHSHPHGMTGLSHADVDYAAAMLAHNASLSNVFLPIVQSSHHGRQFEMHGHAVRLVNGKPRKFQVGFDIAERQFHPSQSALFERVNAAYDLDRLSNSLVIVAGVGGSSSFVDSLVRTGVGHLVLIDPDSVSITNVATQSFYIHDIGQSKVEALGRRVRGINPSVRVTTFQKRLEDVPASELARLLTARRHEAIVLVAMTDSFSAQATANQLALSFGIPLLTAQMYTEGRAGEIVYTVPGVTPACMRCVLSSRYEFYASGATSDVTSAGSPICSADALNSMAVSVALAILHHGSDHPRWGRLIARAGKRNFLQIRLHPDVEQHLGLSIFDKALPNGPTEEFFYGETIWRAVDPDTPANGFPDCPDCGGIGVLPSVGRYLPTLLV